MNKSVKRGVAVTVVLLLLTTTLSGSVWAWNPSYPELWKEYQNQYVDYFPMGVSAEASDVGISSGSLDLDGQVGHHFNAVTVVDFSMALHMGTDPVNNDSAKDYDDRTSITAVSSDPLYLKLAEYDEANRSVVVTPSPDVIAVLDAIRAHNADPANVDDQRYVRANALFTADDRTPSYFFCNGFRYDPVNPDWADYVTIRARIEHYLEEMLKAYIGYGDVIYAIDLVEDLYKDDTTLDGPWGGTFPLVNQANNGGSGGVNINTWPVVWTKQGSSTINAEILMGDIFLDATIDPRVPTRAALYWTESFPLNNTAANDKLTYVEKMLTSVGAIKGFGINAHLSSGVDTISALEQQITQLSSKPVELAITKLDISTELTGGGMYWDPATDSFATIDPKTVEDAVMKKQADYAEDVMRMLIRNSDKIVTVYFDGISDDKNSNDKMGASFWSTTSNANLPASQVHIEKWGFFAVLGTPARLRLEYALSTGPAIDPLKPTDSGIYTQDSWDYYVRAKTTGAAVYADKIYDIDSFYATKKATHDIWDAIKNLKLRVMDFGFPDGIWVSVHLYSDDFKYQIKIDTGGIPVSPTDFKYYVVNETVATADLDGLMTLIKPGMTPVNVTHLGSGIEKTFYLSVESN